jgi:hypothetical protein
MPEEFLGPEPVKGILPAWEDPAKMKEILARIPNVKVYGLLLSADPKSALAEVVRTRWSELHHLSGDEFVVVAFDPPQGWADGLEDSYRKQLGEGFDELAAEWKKTRALTPGAAFEWRDLFSPPISAKDLPCLVLFTDLQSKEAVVRSIPDWDEDAVYRFLMAQFDAVRECCGKPQEERLACLRDSIGSPSAKARSYLGHIAEKTAHYVKEHPATVMMTTVNLAVALGTGNVIPMTGTALGALKAIKEVFGKS